MKQHNKIKIFICTSMFFLIYFYTGSFYIYGLTNQQLKDFRNKQLKQKVQSGGAGIKIMQKNEPLLNEIYKNRVDNSLDGVLFLTEFDNLEEEFTPVEGHDKGWEIIDGQLTGKRKAGKDSQLLFGENTWKDYTIGVTATLTSGNGYGIYYRAESEPNMTGYSFKVDPGKKKIAGVSYPNGTFQIRKIINGKKKYLAVAPIPDNFELYNTPHNIELEIQGNQHHIKLNDQVIFDTTDDGQVGGEPIESGAAGFRAWSGPVSFGDITVNN